MQNEYIKYYSNKKIVYCSVPFYKSNYINNHFSGYNTNITITDNKLICNIDKRNISICFSDNIYLINQSSNGVVLKAKNNYIKGAVFIDKDLLTYCNNRYLSINLTPILPILLINPIIIKKEKEELYTFSYNKINDHLFEFEISCSKHQTITFEIVGYYPKIMFDTVIESYSVNRNNIYSSICYLSNEEYKESLLIRFNYIKMSELFQKKIIKAYLYLRYIYISDNIDLTINEIIDLWCSFNTTYAKKPNYNNLLLQYSFVGQYIKIDVSNIISSFATSKNINHPGFVIQCKKGCINVLTSDCCTYPSYLEVILKEEKTWEK